MRAAALGWDFPFMSFVILAAFGIAFFAGCRMTVRRNAE
jgi:hypothetical protein